MFDSKYAEFVDSSYYAESENDEHLFILLMLPLVQVTLSSDELCLFDHSQYPSFQDFKPQNWTLEFINVKFKVKIPKIQRIHYTVMRNSKNTFYINNAWPYTLFVM